MKLLHKPVNAPFLSGSSNVRPPVRSGWSARTSSWRTRTICSRTVISRSYSVTARTQHSPRASEGPFPSRWPLLAILIKLACSRCTAVVMVSCSHPRTDFWRHRENTPFLPCGQLDIGFSGCSFQTAGSPNVWAQKYAWTQKHERHFTKLRKPFGVHFCPSRCPVAGALTWPLDCPSVISTPAFSGSRIPSSGLSMDLSLSTKHSLMQSKYYIGFIHNWHYTYFSCRQRQSSTPCCILHSAMLFPCRSLWRCTSGTEPCSTGISETSTLAGGGCELNTRESCLPWRGRMVVLTQGPSIQYSRIRPT